MKWPAALLFCLSAASALAAGFDCSKARTLQEHMICEDAELSYLDDLLTSAAKEAYAKSSDRAALKKQMDGEWKRREATCHDKACLVAWYNRRISELNLR